VAQPSLPSDPSAVYRRLLDESEARVELIGGEVVVHAAPGLGHAFGAAAVGADLYQAYQRGRGGPGGWWILPEVDVELDAAHKYRPDVAGWRCERVSKIPSERPVRVVPDFVCEVLSPTNAEWDLGPKRAGYARAGVPWYWSLDPEAQRLEAFELDGNHFRSIGVVTRETPGALRPFDAVVIDMGEVFPIGGG